MSTHYLRSYSLNSAIARLKRSQYGDWVDGYFFTLSLSALALIAGATLFFVYTGKCTPIVLDGFGVKVTLFLSLTSLTFLQAALMLSVGCLQILVLSVVMAICSSFLFRHIPRLSLIWSVVLIILLSFFLAKAIALQFPGPLTFFIAFFTNSILGLLFMSNVIRIVINNVTIRGIQQY